jgi:putative hemolysin
MQTTATVEIILVLALIVANGLFAMSEMALVSARKARLQQRAEAGDANAAAALALANNPDDFLSAIQIGITLVGILAGAFGGATIAASLARRLEAFPALARHGDTIALVTVVLVITYLTLVIGELLPKRLALNSPERIASMMARPTQLMVFVTTPVVRLLTASTDLILKLLGVRPQEGPPVTEAEIRVLVGQATEAGVFEEEEEDLVAGVFRLGDLRAASLMTPRTEMTWLDLKDSPEMAQDKIAAVSWSHYAVMDGSPDNVAGTVSARSLLTRCLGGEPYDLRAALRSPVFVPESTPAIEVLRTFLHTGERLCFVIDEYGGVQGVATLDDITRAVAGDLAMLGSAMKPKASQRADGSWLVDGLMTIEAFKETFELGELPGEEINAYETLGGFAMACLGRIPEVSDRFTWGNLTFEIVDMDGRRVDKVLVQQK